MSHKDAGNTGEAFAIYYYTSKGFIVSKPLFENVPYDLIVDKDGKLYRVQVKTCRNTTSGGKFRVNLRTTGGNRSGKGKSKTISSSEVDLVFVLLSDGRSLEIDASSVDGKTTVNVG